MHIPMRMLQPDRSRLRTGGDSRSLTSACKAATCTPGGSCSPLGKLTSTCRGGSIEGAQAQVLTDTLSADETTWLMCKDG